ncbi:sigma factor, partial [Parapedobacter pyrenivorans]|uniref:sigma factor n=1 Tax=Parapedobacter pyrenivorans TaxID=1305674 RepID=UPI00334108CA
MDDVTLIPRLFRTEYQKIVSVLSNLFGIKHIEIAEDIVSDTFLSATEVWTLRGVPENPTAWLYTVAKNKTRNYFKRSNTYEQKITPELAYRAQNQGYEIEVDLSEKNITDSQLAMIFAVCHPCNPHAAQIALALNLLCGFNVNEIADAYLTNR